jgi:hypothetical protein
MASKLVDPSLKEVFEKLNDDVITLSWKWQILRTLFNTQEKVDLLSETASSFFQACQTTFADDVFLALSRITDSPQIRGQDNLVIARLVDGVDQAQDPIFYKKLKTLTEDALLACKPFRQHRHKRLAHSDLNAKMQTTTNLLPSISVSDINAAVDALQKVLNEFDRYYFERETSYKIMENGGVKSLLLYLQKGVDAFKADDDQARGRTA